MPGDARAARGVRDLVRELALLPVEGGARVAIVEGAARMNEDAQNALLKTLEEPPPGSRSSCAWIARRSLLPTVRSRCARVRLGPVGPREIEGLLGDLGLADASTAARLARLAEGRPGIAVAYARAPEAVAIRDEIARTLLDLLAARTRATAGGSEGPPRTGPRPGGGARRSPWPPPVAAPQASAAPAPEEDDEESAGPARLAPAERRRAARQLLAIWRDLARDLAVRGWPESTMSPASRGPRRRPARGAPTAAARLPGGSPARSSPGSTGSPSWSPATSARSWRGRRRSWPGRGSAGRGMTGSRGPPAIAPVRVDVVVRGRVQGVGYRMFVARAAVGRGLTGWVANEPDGSVRCVAEGPGRLSRRSSATWPSAHRARSVERLEVAWSEAAGRTSTDSRYGPAGMAATDRGTLEAIHLADREGGPMRAVESRRGDRRVGLTGDRYAVPPDERDPRDDEVREVTLVEAEQIEWLAAETGIRLEPGATRRNLTTRGVRLNDLVGRTFRVGAVRVQGVELCEPCAHLQEMVGQPVLRPLVHRAGLRARLLDSGELRVGDPIEVESGLTRPSAQGSPAMRPPSIAVNVPVW